MAEKDFIIKNGLVVGNSITTTNTTISLLNTVATSVSSFGAATTIGIGSTTTSAQTINIGTTSAGTSTYNFGTGSTGSGNTKILNLGTGSAASSTTNINIGSTSGGTTTINSTNVTLAGSGPLTLNTGNPTIDSGGSGTASVFNTTALTGRLFGDASNITIGNTITTSQTITIGGSSTANGSTYNLGTGATATGTKTVNIGINGVASTTTNINLGSANGGTTTVNSPTLSTSAISASGAITTTGEGRFDNTVRMNGGGYWSGALNIQTPSTSTYGIIVRARASQTANLQEWQDSGGNALSSINSSGTGTFNGGVTAGGYAGGSVRLSVMTNSSTVIGAVVKGAASQTANLQEWRDSSDAVLADVDKDGNAFFLSVDATTSFRNVIINGGMNVWQRATASTLTTTASYLSADRWAARQVTSAQAALDRSTSVPTGFQYSAKLGRFVNQTTTGVISMTQIVESVNMLHLANRKIVFSFWAKSGANFSAASSQITAKVSYGTGTDQGLASYLAGTWTGTSDLISTTQVITTTWTRYSFTATLPSTATELAVQISYTPVGTAGADDNIYVTGIQLEPGSAPTQFEALSINTIEDMCKRYYYKIFFNATNERFALGQSTAATVASFSIPFSVAMRIAPTALETSGTAGNFSMTSPNGTTVTVTTLPSFARANVYGAVVNATATGLGSTAGYACQLLSAATTAYLAWSAEL